MKILLAVSTITRPAGVPAFNREVSRAISRENEVHLLTEEPIEIFDNCAKVFSLPKLKLKTTKDKKAFLNIINGERYGLIINSNSKIIALLSPYIINSTKILTVSHSLRYTESDLAAFNTRYLDGIIALSHYNKDYLLKKFRIDNNDKVKVIYNFVSEKEHADEIRNKKKNEKPMSIVFAGGTASTKSPELVIKIINSLVDTDLDFCFYFMGVKNPPLKSIQPFKNVEQIIKKDRRVLLTGKLPYEKANEIISRANIFLAPSRREGCPMALLEAFRVGTIPIVADYKIANRELVNDGINGFVINHRHPNQFVDRIIDIIKKPAEYEYIYDATYKLFQEKLSYGVWYDSIMELINNGDNNISHEKRLKAFSTFRYAKDTIHFSIMDFLNKVHLFFHESLPAAIPILMMYFRRRKINA